MTKYSIIIAILILSNFTFGQTFEVTPDGLRDSQNLENTFIVIPMEGFSAEQLFDNSKRYIVQNHKNTALIILGETDGEYLHLIANGLKSFDILNIDSDIYVNTTYQIEIFFKDGKVRYEINDLEMNLYHNNSPFYFSDRTVEWRVYNKKGKLKLPKAKENIEGYFNSQVKKLTNYLKGNTKVDDW